MNEKRTIVEDGCVASVAVIIPVRNEGLHVRKTLHDVLSQDRTGLHLEILVVDGRSSDNTEAIVHEVMREHPEVRLLDNPHRLSSAARNIGISHSSAEFILIVDGHCEIPSRHYLTDVVGAFKETGADCLGRPQPLDVTNATRLQRAIALARSSWLGHHPASYIYSSEPQPVPAISVAVAYRRAVFDKVGMFDEAFDACEDCELNHRIDDAGMQCYFVPSLAIKYQPRQSLRGLFQQLVRYGQGRARLLRKHPDTFSLASMCPAIFLLGVVLGPLVCLALPQLWIAYFLVLAVYLIAILGVSMSCVSSTRDPLVLSWLPAVFLATHLGSAWGVLRELLPPRQRWGRTSGKPIHV